MVDVSVIICCYNSEHLIEKTLRHIALQNVEGNCTYQVILVDNNCTDQTVSVARNLWDSLDANANLKIVTELQTGLSYARKTGVLHSNADFILFCDDDNWLEADYLQLAYNFMIKNPRVGALGGHSTGVLEMETPPSWWQQEATNYAVGKQALQSGDLTKRGYLWGAGIVIRKDILIRLYQTGFRSLLSDRRGNELSSGGDSEICKWIQLMGFKLWYLDTLKFKHYITKKRLNATYLSKLLEGHYQARNVLHLYNWFICSGIYKKVLSFTLLERYVLLKKGIKAFLKKEIRWKTDLQLALGTFINVYPDLYRIMLTYKNLRKQH